MDNEKEFNIKDKKIIVTGAAGFIGSHLSDKLVNMGARVIGIDNLSYGKLENVNPKVTFLKFDILNYELLQKTINKHKPDFLFHLAAIATTRRTSMGWDNIEDDFQTNARGTLNIFRAVTEKSNKTKIIYNSSAAVYGEPKYIPIDENHPKKPISPYGISKLTSEKYAYAFFNQFSINSTIFRIFNTYGPRQPRYVMFELMEKLKRDSSKLEVLGTGEQIRDYSYIDDTLNSLLFGLKSDTDNQIFNIGSGVSTTIKQVVKKILEIMGLKDKTKIYYTNKSWKGDITKLLADVTKFQKISGYKLKFSIENGLRNLYNWFINRNIKN